MVIAVTIPISADAHSNSLSVDDIPAFASTAGPPKFPIGPRFDHYQGI